MPTLANPPGFMASQSPKPSNAWRPITRGPNGIGQSSLYGVADAWDWSFVQTWMKASRSA